MYVTLKCAIRQKKILQKPMTCDREMNLLNGMIASIRPHQLAG